MTTVSTNLGNTRESARQIRFEPTGGISSTNVQKALEEVLTDVLPSLTTPTVMTATGAIAVTDIVVQTNQAGFITLTVPSSVLWAAQNGRYGLPLSIFDITGIASTNNVAINFTGGETASGQSSLTINTDFGGFSLEPKSGGGWIVI